MKIRADNNDDEQPIAFHLQMLVHFTALSLARCVLVLSSSLIQLVGAKTISSPLALKLCVCSRLTQKVMNNRILCQHSNPQAAAIPLLARREQQLFRD